ncbi:hypothetical protein DFA_07174 [Cavenderia fasciculata]|uniref:Paramecium surface antigen repeat-containing protein n=1 Tax=Cavenderia fasciculata TaxID=261658 RepID=F4PVP3_CACFS|nr:uncharacterized protein DFA_07174 [Cavenderia fasciculata]EGG20057.1 hypothetical protein DFA_07174 [Cavenderia fasciculata]|eukprot:XP_004367040.1 hypothetical protein DFA_07174 [Cavenderia fasciculata]
MNFFKVLLFGTLVAIGLVSTLVFASADCASMKCGLIGDACDLSDLHFCSNSYCKFGSNWSGTCTAFIPENGACLEDEQYLGSCYPGLSCYDSKCVQSDYAQYGESCTQDYQCSYGLTCSNSQCSFGNSQMPLSCEEAQEGCPYGTFCNRTDYNNDVCTPQLDIGDDCTMYNTGVAISWGACRDGSLCNQVGNDSTSYVCTALYSLGLGQTCTLFNERDENPTQSTCDASQGLYCPKDGGVCTPLPAPSNAPCSLFKQSECNFNEVCTCLSKGDVNGTCSVVTTINSECADATTSYFNSSVPPSIATSPILVTGITIFPFVYYQIPFTILLVLVIRARVIPTHHHQSSRGFKFKSSISLSSSSFWSYQVIYCYFYCTLINNSVQGDTCPSINAQCIQVGERCELNSTQICSSSFCAPSSNSSLIGTCTTFIQENGRCGTSDLICNPGLSCNGGNCVQTDYLQTGERCTQAYQCSKGLSCGGACSLIGECSINERVCAFGKFCNTTGRINICSPQLMVGDDCTLFSWSATKGNDPCPYGSICNQYSSTDYRCTALYSQGVGQKCTANPNDPAQSTCSVSQGLYCNNGGAGSGICASIPSPSNASCATDNDCNIDETCDCSNGPHGKCVVVSYINTQCATATLSYYKCLTNNHCAPVPNYLNLNSCAAKNCGDKWCRTQNSCYNQEIKPPGSECWADTDIFNSLVCPTDQSSSSSSSMNDTSSGSNSNSTEPSLSSSLSSPTILVLFLLIVSLVSFLY